MLITATASSPAEFPGVSIEGKALAGACGRERGLWPSQFTRPLEGSEPPLTGPVSCGRHKSRSARYGPAECTLNVDVKCRVWWKTVSCEP